MTALDNDSLPRWSVADVHESLTSRTFRDAMELMQADTTRLEATFDQLNIRGLADGVEAVVDAETGQIGRAHV